MSRRFIRGVVLVSTIALASPPPEAFAQPKPPPVAQSAAATQFNVEQLDAMLAPIALYPDELLTQTLMASTFRCRLWRPRDGSKRATTRI
jgi:hypothetical protein